MAYQFKNIEKIIGAFIIVSFLLLVAAVIFIGKGKKLFSKKIHYTTRFYSAEGVPKGMKIMFKGVEVGEVEDLEFDTNYEVGTPKSLVNMRSG